jgi:hypothetical protein
MYFLPGSQIYGHRHRLKFSLQSPWDLQGSDEALGPGQMCCRSLYTSQVVTSIKISCYLGSCKFSYYDGSSKISIECQIGSW